MAALKRARKNEFLNIGELSLVLIGKEIARALNPILHYEEADLVKI